jgi:hypothetical protein
MKELIDLTNKLAKKHGPLVQRNENARRIGKKDLDYFYISALTLTLIILVMEPLFIYIFRRFIL